MHSLCKIRDFCYIHIAKSVLFWIKSCKICELCRFVLTLQGEWLKNGVMIRQCAVLFGCLALGELVVFLTGVKLPSSIIGMLLLTLFLKLGWVKLKWVQGLSDFLVANLGFFFVPPGVALMLYFDIIGAQFWPIVIATVVSTALVLVVTGRVHQIVRKWYGIFRK